MTAIQEMLRQLDANVTRISDLHARRLSVPSAALALALDVYVPVFGS